MLSDALDLRWGAHLGFLRTQGFWFTEELPLHTNARELKAICVVCEVFLLQRSGKIIHVLTGNTTLMYYVIKQGGARSIAHCQEAVLLWDFCMEHAIYLEALHVLGIQEHIGRSPQ